MRGPQPARRRPRQGSRLRARIARTEGDWRRLAKKSPPPVSLGAPTPSATCAVCRRFKMPGAPSSRSRRSGAAQARPTGAPNSKAALWLNTARGCRYGAVAAIKLTSRPNPTALRAGHRPGLGCAELLDTVVTNRSYRLPGISPRARTRAPGSFTEASAEYQNVISSTTSPATAACGPACAWRRCSTTTTPAAASSRNSPRRAAGAGHRGRKNQRSG